jgi:AcrR family transcriptional regulator
MSPRRPAALREAGADTTLRDHLIAVAARMIDERSGATLTVRDIAGGARVADGVLYNHFHDKDELLGHALVAHIHAVMATLGELPRPGQDTVDANVRVYLERGLDVLTHILPTFGSFLTQPGVLAHVRPMLAGAGPGLPNLLTTYFAGEQELGRIAPTVDVHAAATLVVGACHEMVLPRLLLDPTAPPPQIPAEFVGRLADVVLNGVVRGEP